MIIWTGWGILIGIIGIGCLVTTQLAVNAAMHDPRFYQTHGWPKLVGLLIAAAVSWPIGRAMNQGEEQEVVDPESGKPVIVRSGGGGHSLFFIPVQYWWIVFAILGVVFAFA
jgi:hypothetical protein